MNFSTSANQGLSDLWGLWVLWGSQGQWTSSHFLMLSISASEMLSQTKDYKDYEDYEDYEVYKDYEL